MRRNAHRACAAVGLSALLAAGCNEKKPTHEMQDPTVTPAPAPTPAPASSNAEYFASDPAEGNMSSEASVPANYAYVSPTMSMPVEASGSHTSSVQAGGSAADDSYGGMVASGSATSTTVAGGPTVHRVARGDTLYRIARKYYNDGNRWKDIAKANGISKPDKLKVGQELVIP